MEVSKVSKIMSVNIDVPVTTAYSQWTQFVPKLIGGVDSVRQIDGSTLHWKSAIGGVTREWTARITEQTPDERIAWISIDGAINAGVVMFHRLSDATCRVALQLDYEPEGLIENVDDAPGVVSCRCERCSRPASRSSSSGAGANPAPFAARSRPRTCADRRRFRPLTRSELEDRH